MSARFPLQTFAPWCVVLGVRVAVAQTSNAATAEDLFQQGTAAMRSDQFARACPLLAESYRLDPAGGTLQNLAVCYEGEQKVASAYARFEELKTLSKNASPPRVDRIQLAETHLARLTPKLSRARVALARGVQPPAGLVLQIDGVTYGEASWASGILLDPGEHALTLRAPGRRPFSTALRITHDGTVLQVRVPELANAVQPASDAAPSALGTAGWITAGVGAAALAAGGVVGVLAFTTNGRAERACAGPQGNCAAPETDRANEVRDQARTFANAANVLLPVGAVAAVVGGLLIWRGHRSGAPTSARVQFAPTLGGAGLGGTF